MAGGHKRVQRYSDKSGDEGTFPGIRYVMSSAATQNAGFTHYPNGGTPLGSNFRGLQLHCFLTGAIFWQLVGTWFV
jgi:hypothetical protein